MRRYAFNYDIDDVEKLYYDVIVIGSGIAGLYAAYNVDDNLNCVVLSKDEVDVSSSSLAQGGIAAVTNVKDDDFEIHYEDTLKAGAGVCDKDSVKVLVKEGPQDIKRLISLGVNFDLDDEGHLLLTREGGHRKNRIVHCGGDSTGREVVERLAKLAKDKKNISLKENVFAVDIITYEDNVVGVMVYDKGYKLYVCQNVIIASGGIGQVYKYTTNPVVATGDGIAAAARAGAKLKNMEFVQFHPTGFYNEEIEKQCFLISEALRGEGAVLRNQKKERFMIGRHPMAELAPRDIVAREIFKEIKASGVPYVYLDITSKSEDFLSRRFPTIYNKCKQYNINISEQYIPVCPVQHYFMGGIKTDLDGQTNIKGLYACGEAACTGVHGANRLASNSTLECLVSGRRCVEHINSNFVKTDLDFNMIKKSINSLPKDTNKIDVKEMKNKIKNIMTAKGGIVRSSKVLEEGLSEINEIVKEIEATDLSTVKHIEIFNMAIVAQNILKAALNRKESVGAHYIVD